MYKVLSAGSCSGGDTEASSSIHSSQSKFPIKKPHVILQESFTSSGKQGGGATVLGEGRDIVTRGTYNPTSLT
jgi:hypothetical protein